MKSDVQIPKILVFKEFWRGIKPYRPGFFVSLFCYTAAPVITIIVPLFYKDLFDLLGTSGDRTLVFGTLVRILFIILWLHGIQWVLFRVGTIAYNSMESSVMAQLKQNAFDYLMHHSYGFFANNFTGSLVQRVNRFSRAFEQMLDSITLNLIPLAISVIGSVVITWTMAPLISYVIFGWVLLFSVFNFIFSRWKQKYDVAASLADSATTGLLSDNITNHNSVSLFTAYDYESASYKESTNDQASKTLYSWNLSEVVNMVQVSLIYIVEFVVFYYAVVFWSRGALTVGTFVLIQVYIIGVAQQLWGLNRIFRGMYQAMADSKEMVEIMSLPHEIKDLPGAEELVVGKGEIMMQDVSFNFNETREVLREVNAVIKPGEKIALVGPSGAGKTTFVRLILRLYDLTKGKILIDGQDISRVTLESLHRNVSLVPQDPVLFHRTLLENIRYGKRDATVEEVMAAAKLAHCDDFIEELPLKYETFVGERGIKLSGGERQRVAIARAILKNAPILILDEATSSLDSHSESLIQDALENLMRGRTTIVIAHRLSTIRKMDRIAVLENGGIAEVGTHDELIKKEGGLYQKLWNLQVSGFIQDK